MAKNHILEGSVFKSIFTIALPIIFANILQMVYQLIDTFWVGRLGTKAVAAVSLSFPILFFITSLAMGLAMAGSILVAQYNGKKDYENVSFVTGQTLALILLFAFVLTIIGYFSSGWLLSFLTQDPLVLVDATAYLQILFLSISTVFIFNIFQSSLRGIGEVKLPMLVILVTVIINFFLDPLFMFGWKFVPALGVSGVAWATLITESISALVGIIILLSGKYNVRLRLKDLKLRWSWVKKIFILGFPSSLEMSSRSFGMVLMTFIVSTFGTLVIAAYGIGTRILSFVIIPAVGFSVSTSVLVGNNLGAKQHQRAEKIISTGIKIGFFVLTIIGVLLFLFARYIAGFFVPGETELITTSAFFIRIMALTFGFIGIQMVVVGALKAAGKTTTSMLLAMFHTFFLFVTSYLLANIFKLGELGIWIAYPVANTFALGLAFYFYKKKDWLKKELV